MEHSEVIDFMHQLQEVHPEAGQQEIISYADSRFPGFDQATLQTCYGQMKSQLWPSEPEKFKSARADVYDEQGKLLHKGVPVEICRNIGLIFDSPNDPLKIKQAVELRVGNARFKIVEKFDKHCPLIGPVPHYDVGLQRLKNITD